jgi:hypothetical protein
MGLLLRHLAYPHQYNVSVIIYPEKLVSMKTQKNINRAIYAICGRWSISDV